jgi:hypothetical protein
MTLGGLIEADRRLIAHEKVMRQTNRLKRDAAVWKAYEEDFEAAEKRREILNARKVTPAAKEATEAKGREGRGDEEAGV